MDTIIGNNMVYGPSWFIHGKSKIMIVYNQITSNLNNLGDEESLGGINLAELAIMAGAKN